MTYDAVVIGAGLAGLTASLRLAERGLRVLVVARGVGATQLAGGTIDVLGYGDERVESPARALPAFASAHPEHPFALLSPARIAAAIEWFKERMTRCRYVGGLEENLLLPTAVGAAKPSAVVPETMAAGDLRGGGSFAFVGFRALKDFYPAYLADNVRRAPLPSPVFARALELAPPVDGEADVNAVGLAARFERAEFRSAVVRELVGRLEPAEAVGFPAVLGIDDAHAVWRDLERTLGTRVFEVPTLPPSVPGLRVSRALTGAIRKAGGRIVIGGTVAGAATRRGRLEGVAVESAARPLEHRARFFVLASGGFASRGLEMDSRGSVRETVFGLPVAGVPDGERFRPGYFDRHPLARAGVAVDDSFRPVDRDGRVVYENLHAAGATLAGAEPWREKSGDGIALATGHAAASAILERA